MCTHHVHVTHHCTSHLCMSNSCIYIYIHIICSTCIDINIIYILYIIYHILYIIYYILYIIYYILYIIYFYIIYYILYIVYNLYVYIYILYFNTLYILFNIPIYIYILYLYQDLWPHQNWSHAFNFKVHTPSSPPSNVHLIEFCSFCEMIFSKSENFSFLLLCFDF